MPDGAERPRPTRSSTYCHLVRACLRHLVAVTLLVLGASVLAVPTWAAVPPVGPDDVVTLLSGDGAISRGWSAAMRGPDGLDLVVADGGRDDISVRLGGPDQVAGQLALTAPLNRPRLEPGTYVLTPDRSADEPSFLLQWDLRACASWTGSLTVLEATRDAAGQLSGLAVDYSTTCEGDDSPDRGSLRWASDVPYGFTQTAALTLPDTGPGLTASGEVEVRNAGTMPQTYGASEFVRYAVPSTSTAPVTLVDGCLGRTLQPGATCTVGVSVPSDGVASLRGALRTVDGTPARRVDTPVSMRAVRPPVRVALFATPVRGGVELELPVPVEQTYRLMRTPLGAAGPPVVLVDDARMRVPITDTSVVPGEKYRYEAVALRGGLEAEPTVAVGGPLPSPVGQEGTYTPVEPFRALDTRVGDGARKGPLGPGDTVAFSPGSGGRLPAGVSAVLLNVTATAATERTHVRAWATGTARPGTSSLNVVPGRTRANQVVVPLGAGGTVSLSNAAGRTHLVVDVQGFYSDVTGSGGGEFHPVVKPLRFLDTRATGAGPVGAGQDVWVPLRGLRLDGASTSDVTAVDVTITVTRPTTSGHVTAWSGLGAAPLASNVNFVAGQTVANHAVVPVGRHLGYPAIRLRNSDGRTHVVVDVQGWYDDGDTEGEEGLRFTATTQARVEDTRTSGPQAPSAGSVTVAPGQSMPSARAHVVNVTSTRALGAGYLTAWSGDGTEPSTSTLNYQRGEDAASLAVVRAGRDGQLAVSSHNSATHVVVDHLGFFW